MAAYCGPLLVPAAAAAVSVGRNSCGWAERTLQPVVHRFRLLGAHIITFTLSRASFLEGEGEFGDKEIGGLSSGQFHTK